MTHRTFLPTLALALASTLAHGQGLQDLSFGTAATFDVVTWNVETFPKDGQTTIDAVGQVLEALDADVYALQEIDDLGDLQAMVDALPEYTAFYQSSFFAGLVYVYKPATVQIQGLYEIYTTQPYWSTFPRSPVVMEATFAGEDVVVINNHFKCCGDGDLDLGDPSDEETRRWNASQLLQTYIETNFPNDRVILVGDLNDDLLDPPSDNVFQGFLDAPADYQFVDLGIAAGSSSGWSYPSWPSHLDHLMITDELFAEFASPAGVVETIPVDAFLPGGWSQYDAQITDHRPVGLRLPLGDPCSEVVAPALTFRVGSPPNPFVLLPGQPTGPTVGSTWSPFVEHAAWFPTATIDVLAVSAAPPVNVPTQHGTLLCELPGPDQIFVVVAGTPFTVQVPDDCGLRGLAVCAQAASVGGGQIAFTNAIDLVLGSN